MQELYKFVVNKAKIQGIKLEDLAKNCRFSRSALWRYMKGVLPVTSDVEEILANALCLNDSEREKFRYYIGLTVSDENLLKARYALDELVFEGNQRIAPIDISVIFYNQERYLRTLTEVFDLILSHIPEKDFVCNVRVIAGVGEGYFPAAAAFLHELLSRSPSSSAEHLIAFTGTDYLKSVQSLITALPLLRYENYSLFYQETNDSDGIQGMLRRSFHIDCSYEKEGVKKREFFIISILDYSMPECIRFEDNYMERFITGDYNEMKRQFESGFYDFRNIDIKEQFLIDWESSADAYSLKRDLCYNKIPTEVYRNLSARVGAEGRRLLAEKLSGKALDQEQAEEVILRTISGMDMRFKASFTNRHVDVYSKEGLLEFARTGRLTDHLDGLPPFSKEEMRICFEYIRDRNNDEKDAYRLYITEKDILHNGYIIMALKNKGVLIEYNRTEHSGNMRKNLWIKNKTVTEIVCDYAQNHIPSRHAITKKQTTDFLNQLIEDYCQ